MALMLFRTTCLLGLLSLPVIAGPNLVVNPGFETGDFTGWTPSGNLIVLCNSGVVPAHSGNCDARFAGASDLLSQSITTIPGHSYTLDFWFHYFAETSGNGSFSASWNGSPIFSQNDSGSANPPYTHEVFPGLSVSSGSTPLLFTGNLSNALYILDDVNVVDNSAAPEPGTIGTLLAGLAVLVSSIRIRRKK